LIRYKPALPRIGFGIAALLMTALTFGLMIVLPSELEAGSDAVALRTGPHRTSAAASASGTLHFRCTVPPAVNAPLFWTARTREADARCKQQS
jgi:hypothetical protein